MPIHAKKEKPIEVDMSVREASRPIKYVPKSTEKKPFVPADPRCGECYYWRVLSGYSEGRRGCHFALDNGKLRHRISEVECGSFLPEKDGPKLRNTFDDVPITQWGIPECIDWRSQR